MAHGMEDTGKAQSYMGKKLFLMMCKAYVPFMDGEQMLHKTIEKLGDLILPHELMLHLKNPNGIIEGFMMEKFFV